MAEGDLFDPVWAEEGEVEVPTSLQIRSGFLCGPVSPGLFNWLFQTLQAADNGLSAITKTLESMQSVLRQARQDKRVNRIAGEPGA